MNAERRLHATHQILSPGAFLLAVASIAVAADPVPASDFTSTGPMEAGRARAATAPAGAGALVAGGISGVDPVDTGEPYDSCAATFIEASVMSARRAFHAQIPLADGAVLLAGGEDSLYGVTRTADRHDAPRPGACPIGPLEAVVHVVPRALNLRSGGRFVTVFVGVPGHRTREIDVASLELWVDGTGPLRSASPARGSGDHDGDPVADVMLKFSRAGVAAIASTGGAVPFVVGDRLKDGTPFSGTDPVRAIRPGHGGH